MPKSIPVSAIESISRLDLSSLASALVARTSILWADRSRVVQNVVTMYIINEATAKTAPAGWLVC